MIGSLALKDNGESAMKGRTDTIGSLNLSNSNLNCLAQSQEIKTSKFGSKNKGNNEPESPKTPIESP